MRHTRWLPVLVALVAVLAVATTGAVADGTVQQAQDANVTVETGTQLSTVVAVTADDVHADVDDAALPDAGNESERADAIAQRAEALRERANDIAREYAEATSAFENGTIDRSEYARRLAVLSAHAENVAESVEELADAGEDVSERELRATGHNETALNQSVADLEALTGTGPNALLARFSGLADGEIELEDGDGLRIEAESEDGERSREVRRPRDNETGFEASQSDALATARDQLSAQSGNWTLVEASVHDDGDGYYEFEFVLDGANETGEAEVRIDGSSGNSFRVEEEIEPREDEREDDEGERDEETETEEPETETEDDDDETETDDEDTETGDETETEDEETETETDDVDETETESTESNG